ncbi:hypothetical protein [Streptomyces xanthochromogenes]|uniref:hypothetical protein n=1 Tax=Streptomyces xanthochromogenes TaxID=67384 RepID=UPI0016790307|nr:hypothetical protein [Streptomyces xanthochromogenes]
MRNRRFVVCGAAVAGLLVAGCGGSGADAPRDVGKLLDGASARPCSAELQATSLRDGVQVYRSWGRMNLNGPLTGRFDDQVKGHPVEDVVITATRVYRRPVTGGGSWTSFDASTAEGGIPVKNLRGYARLLLDHGARAVDGDDEGTGPTQRLSARIASADLKGVDPIAAGNLDGVGSVASDLWVDGRGRVVRVEQQLHAPDGSAIKNTLTLRDFGDPTSVTAPG